MSEVGLYSRGHGTTHTARPHSECELTILMPCLNEAETLARCIAKARGLPRPQRHRRRGAGRRQRQHRRLAGRSPRRRARASCRSPRSGYGSALLGGIRAARGRYVIMGDADDSYDFSQLDAFVEQAARRLRAGDGQPLPRRHRARGDAVAAPLSRQPGADRRSAACSSAARAATSIAACAASSATRSSELDLQAPGMEFASEMVVKATLHGLRIAEVPTTLSPDGRSPPAASAQLARRLAAPALPAAVQPALAVPVSRAAALFAGSACAVMAWLLPAPRTIGGVDARHPHAVLCVARRGGGLPFDVVLGVCQDLRRCGRASRRRTRGSTR